MSLALQRPRRALVPTLVLIVGASATLVAACGDDGSGTGDAGPTDGGVADGGASLVAPAAAPVLTSDGRCPTGWAPTPRGELSACDPLPGDVAGCGAGEARLPGDATCVPVGSPCGADEWPADLPAGRQILYVRAGAAAGGDGTRAAPYASIGAAVGLLSADGIVAVARGTYVEEAVRPRVRMSIVGACAAETIVRAASASRTAGTISVLGTEVVIRNLTITGPRPGLLVDGTSLARSVSLDGVIFDHTTFAGMVVAGMRAQVTGTSVVIRDSQPDADRIGGLAMTVELGAQVDLARAVLERNVDIAVRVLTGSHVALHDAIVRDTESASSRGDGGNGLVLDQGSSALLERVLFERNREAAIYVTAAGSTLDATDVVIRDTSAPRAVGALNFAAINVDDGASARFSRVLLEHNLHYGALVDGAGASLTLSDALVLDMVVGGPGDTGIGLLAVRGASLVAARVAIQGAVEAAVGADGDGTSIVVTDLLVRDTLVRPSDGLLGRAVDAQRGGTITGERVHVANSREGGVLAMGPGASVRLVDATIETSMGTDCPSAGCPSVGGIGVGAYVGGSIELRRFAVSHHALAGVQLATDGQVDLWEGEVVGNVVGVNVQVSDFDLGRVQHDVLYRDNERTLDATELPVPLATLSL